MIYVVVDRKPNFDPHGWKIGDICIQISGYQHNRALGLTRKKYRLLNQYDFIYPEQSLEDSEVKAIYNTNKTKLYRFFYDSNYN